MNIPRRLGHIWIGPKKAPSEWMKTWVDMHPTWHYTLYDNEFLKKGNFKTQDQIAEYMKRGQYAGAADLLRYEILYEVGGYMPGADSICLHSIDELFDDDRDLYTVYENEFVRGKLVSPIMAARPKHPFVGEIIERLSKVPPEQLDVPWKQTGNYFIACLIEEYDPNIVIWPSHYFIPRHFTGRQYMGNDKIYAHQLFGTTTGRYEHSSILDRLANRFKKRYARRRVKELEKRSASDDFQS